MEVFTVQAEATEHDDAGEVAAMRTRLSDVSAKMAALEAQHATAQLAWTEKDTQHASAAAALQEQLREDHRKLSHAEAAAEVLQQALADAKAALASAFEESAALRLEAEKLRFTLRTKGNELQQQAAQADTWESECFGRTSSTAYPHRDVMCGVSTHLFWRMPQVCTAYSNVTDTKLNHLRLRLCVL